MSAYTNVTPSGGFLKGGGKTLQFTLKDSGGTGVTGERANITLYIVEPSGSITKTNADLTDAGSGVYTYKHTFDEAGEIFWTWTWNNSSDPPIVKGNRMEVSDTRAAEAQS